MWCREIPVFKKETEKKRLSSKNRGMVFCRSLSKSFIREAVVLIRWHRELMAACLQRCVGFDNKEPTVM